MKNLFKQIPATVVLATLAMPAWADAGDLGARLEALESEVTPL